MVQVCTINDNEEPGVCVIMAGSQTYCHLSMSLKPEFRPLYHQRHRQMKQLQVLSTRVCTARYKVHPTKYLTDFSCICLFILGQTLPRG